jgi:hypothetical protein
VSDVHWAIEEAKGAAQNAAKDEFVHGTGIMKDCVNSAVDAFLASLQFNGCEVLPPRPKCGCKTEWVGERANITLCAHHMERMAT